MKHKIQLIFRVCFLYALLFTACEFHQPQEEDLFPTPALIDSEDCVEGSENNFAIAQISIPATFCRWADYAFSLSSGSNPYYSADCMCNVVQYELVFDQLPQPLGSGITVTDGNNPLPFYVDADLYPPYYTIVVNDPTVLGDAAEYLLLGFDDANFSANLIYSGGLCVIDNIGGYFDGDTTTLYYSPIILTYPPKIPGRDSIQKVFIPADITISK